MSGPHDDVEKENTRLRKEAHLLREGREVQKRRQFTDRQGHVKHDPERFLCGPKPPLVHVNMHCWAVGEVRLYRHLERRMASRVSLQSYVHWIWQWLCVSHPYAAFTTQIAAGMADSSGGRNGWLISYLSVSSIASAGVFHPSVFLGRLFRVWATASNYPMP
jgi:hypothetical protein